MNNLAIAVVIKDSRVLVQHRYRSGKGMVFEFPGGSMDAGETAEAAARRELWEETGIEGEGLLAMAQYSAINAFGSSIFYVLFSADETVIPVVVDPERKQEFLWFLANEIPVTDFYPADTRFIESSLIDHV